MNYLLILLLSAAGLLLRGTELPALAEDTTGGTELLQSPVPAFRTAVVKYSVASLPLGKASAAGRSTKGSETLYVDAAGNRFRRETSIEDRQPGGLAGILVHLYDGEKYYQLNIDKKQAVFFDIKPLAGAASWQAPTGKGELLGRETFLGRECEVRKDKKKKRCIWNGLLLWEEKISGPLKQLKTAQDIAIDVALDAKLFELPKDWQVVTFEQAMREMSAEQGGLGPEPVTFASPGAENASSPIPTVAQPAAGPVAGTPEPRTADRSVSLARSLMNLVSTSLNLYHKDVGAYPTTEEGLAALREPPASLKDGVKWRGPYLHDFLDPWGNQFIYRCPGAYNPDGFDLYSLGPDASGDGSGADDIGNWGR